MSEGHITRLLERKHEKDVFVAQCKNGPTQTARAQLRILDAWVMPRSWTQPALTGYEIKVDRQDFLRDEKWNAYLAMCHRLYFVSPKGLIDPSELPEGVGLMYATAKRVTTVRKAAHREIECPELVFRYVLMCRATIERERNSYQETREDRMERWRRWLREKDDRRALGTLVAHRIRDMIAEVRLKNEELRNENATLEATRRLLEEAGITNLYEMRGALHSKRAALTRIFGVDGTLEQSLRRAHITLAKTLEEIERLQEKSE